MDIDKEISTITNLKNLRNKKREEWNRREAERKKLDEENLRIEEERKKRDENRRLSKIDQTDPSLVLDEAEEVKKRERLEERKIIREQQRLDEEARELRHKTQIQECNEIIKRIKNKEILLNMPTKSEDSLSPSKSLSDPTLPQDSSSDNNYNPLSSPVLEDSKTESLPIEATPEPVLNSIPLETPNSSTPNNLSTPLIKQSAITEAKQQYQKKCEEVVSARKMKDDLSKLKKELTQLQNEYSHSNINYPTEPLYRAIIELDKASKSLKEREAELLCVTMKEKFLKLSYTHLRRNCK
jgi:hypothetical protein